MPVIKSAIKKLRKDVKRTAANNDFRHKLDLAINKAKKSKSAASVREAVSMVDRAVKNNLMHKNRAARIKSSLSKLAKPAAKSTAKAAVKTAKNTEKVKSAKTVKALAKKTPVKTKKSSK